MIACAAVADVCRYGGEVCVSEEIADRFRSTEGEDGEAAGVVDSDVTGYVCEEGAEENMSDSWCILIGEGAERKKVYGRA